MLKNSIKTFMLVLCLSVSMMSFCKGKVLFVEANIGGGKTTFLKVLAKHLDAVMVSEPCDEWQDISGHNLLDAFYKDGSRWACTFQLYAFMTRLKKQQRYSFENGKLQIMERSWFSDRYCFAQNAVQLGMMSAMEWCLYMDIWNWFAQQAVMPIGFIYLRVDPETCYKRMQLRARTEESIVPLDYLKVLHERHEEWLIDKKYQDTVFGQLPVLVLDGAADFKNDEKVQKEFAQKILDFLQMYENVDF